VVCRWLVTLAYIAIGSAAACVDLKPPPPAGAEDAGVGPGNIDARDSDRPAVDVPGQVSDSALDRGISEVGGDAPLQTPGHSCSTALECLSGFCVEGVCCDSACAGPCRTCRQPGATGICTFVADGEDVNGDCVAEAPTTCGRDGTCNGAGECRFHPAGTPCAPGACTGGIESAPRTCNGAGSCRPPATKPCEPYTCAGTVCGTSCSGNEQCISTSFCNTATMTCAGLKPAGAACQRANECLSRFCVDGVCCQTACTEPCRSCGLAGTAGICTPIAAGEDPDNECPTDLSSTCGRDGSCDSQGGCRLHPAGTLCVPQTCTGSTLSPARTCDGAGICQPTASVSCPYGCADNSCAASPPAAPTGLNATAGNAQITLNWTGSASATSYTVKRSTTNGAGYTNVATGVTATAYTDTGLTNGTTYYYVVSAVSGAGESAHSNQASATPVAPLSPPAPPTGLMATAGDAQVILSWTGSAGATSYTVKRSTTNGSGYTNVATGVTATTHTDLGLVNGTTYYYVVSAANLAGESGNSNQASATPEKPASATGTISFERWTNISGNTISSIPVSKPPSVTGTYTSFEAPSNIADWYGQRVRGYLHPPTTGNYVFWIASDNAGELWLSTDDNPANKRRIANVSTWTGAREWNKFSSQKSVAISLTAGQKYYIEALHKEDHAEDNLAVGWAKPGQATTAPSEVVPGSALSPFSTGM
jgi:hypothetical protein